MFKTYFNFSAPIDSLKTLFKAKGKKKKNELVELIEVKGSNLKDETEKMSKEEITTNQIQTTNQMLSRWPIALAQLSAGNNSEKLENEIRQLLHSLHRSENLTKSIKV